MKSPEQLLLKGGERALVAGSFDPVSLGHMALIDYAAKTFSEVHAVIFINAEKTCFFDLKERLALLEAACQKYENVKTGSFSGMLYAYAKEEKIDFTVRGYRNETDLSYEKNMADFNEKALPGLETLLLQSRPDQRWISSTKIREILRDQGDFSPFVPPETVELLQSFLKEKRCKKM
jgi:pantetheine-phosphate adenylyltransferase